MKILILALSYLLVFLVNGFYDDLSNHAYYLLSAGSCFILFILCIDSADKLIVGYAFIQLIAMIIYVQMITPIGFSLAGNFMYSGVINYANGILLYESLLLVMGISDVYDAMHRYINDNYMHSYRS